LNFLDSLLCRLSGLLGSASRLLGDLGSMLGGLLSGEARVYIRTQQRHGGENKQDDRRQIQQEFDDCPFTEKVAISINSLAFMSC
jgi:hypothetical protein